MRKFLLSLYCLQLCFGCFAQPYKSYFGSEYTKWHVYESGCSGTFATYLTCCNRIKQIDGISYKCLFNLYGSDNITVPENTPCLGYLREDRNTGQLFFRYSNSWNDSSEVKVSDMSLEVGDSVRMWLPRDPNYYYGWENIIISDDKIPYAEVDSVYYSDGLKHIRTAVTFINPLSYNRRKNHLTFIETIGSNISPLFAMDYFYNTICSESTIVNCYETEDIFIHFSDFDCWWQSVSLEEINEMPEIKDEINNGILSLHFNKSLFGSQINLIDISGRTLFQKKIFNETNLIFDVSKYSKGTYILQVRSKNNELINKKITIF